MHPEYAALALVLAAALAAAALLRQLERRIPLWFARRGGAGDTPAPAAVLAWRRPVVLALLLPKLAVWIAAASLFYRFAADTESLAGSRAPITARAAAQTAARGNLA